MPTALIADDEPHLVADLRRRLALLWPELDVVATAQHGLEAIEMCRVHPPDIAFLDIRMPGATGLQVAEQLAGLRKTPRIVFVTAHDEYALHAFEQAAVDYVLKPCDDMRLGKTVQRLRSSMDANAGDALAGMLKQLQAAMAGEAHGAARYLKWIRAAQGNDVHLVPVEEVVYIQASDKYVSVFTADRELILRTPLRELLEQLDPARFWQIHRSTLVAAEAISCVNRDLGGRMRVRLKTRREALAVSRAYAGQFKQM